MVSSRTSRSQLIQTYSHLLITNALRKPLKSYAEKNKLPEPKGSALLLGSVLPDVLLIVITIVCGLIDLSRGATLDPRTGSRESSLMWQLFDDWFFNNPWVITAQNLFHSPLLVAVFILTAYLLWRRGRATGWFFWLFCAAMLHTLIDIPLHANDGPLLLFPLNWSLRFESPISYWDPQFYGREFFIFEHLLDLVLVTLLLVRAVPKLWRRLRKSR